MSPPLNTPVPGAREFYPLTEPAIGSAFENTDVYPQNKDIPALFTPLTLRGVTFKNRIWVSPMCQYSSSDGHATDWHLVHIGGFATRGVGAICMEATAVVPEGRISPEDAGLWADTQIAPLRRTVDFAHAHGTKVGVQLAHAGRKASTRAPWARADGARTCVAGADEGGWPDNVRAPSEIPFIPEQYPDPKALSAEEIQSLEDAFVAAIERCKKAGFDFIELHAAHGYLLHNFLSPLSNARTDALGGPALASRLRVPLALAARARAAWAGPLLVRISATDWAAGPERAPGGEWLQWGPEQSAVLAGELARLGVDLVDVSAGGNWAQQQIPLGPGYQVPFAAAIKKAHPRLAVAAVGLITEPHQAAAVVAAGHADVVFLARALLRDPHWALRAAEALGVAVKAANQYERAWAGAPRPLGAGREQKRA